MKQLWNRGHVQPPIPDFHGQLWEGKLNNVKNSVSPGYPAFPEYDDEEMWGPPINQYEPSRGKYYMLDTDPDAQAGLARSQMGIGREVILLKTNKSRVVLEYRICKGDHLVCRCPVIVSKNVSFDALRKMSVEARMEYFKTLGLGQYFSDSSTRGSAIENKENAANKSGVAVDKGKIKAVGIEDTPAQSSSQGCAVENKLCLICGSNELPTGACSYNVRIPRGVKVSSFAEIICECCEEVGAHHEDEERVKYYAALKFCGYCYAMGSHSAESEEDCPNKVGQERL